MNDIFLINIHEVTRKVGVSRTTIWRKLKEGKFPRPVYLSDQCVRWKSKDIDDWIASLPTKFIPEKK